LHETDQEITATEKRAVYDHSSPRYLQVKGYLDSFITLAPYINFSLLDPDKKKLKRLVGKLNNSELNGKEYSVWTIKEFKKSLRKFYQFQTGEDDPEILDFMTTTIKQADKPMTSPDELPGPEEVKRLVRTRDKARDKALIFFAWDTGGRISEILNVKWKDVRFVDKGAKVKFRVSKSMKREIPIYECVEHLREWKQESPAPNDNDYVFVNNSNRGGNGQYKGKQMSYNAAARVFNKASKEVEPDCKTNPHAFRKGRATFLASKGMNAAQLCEYFGWNDFATAKTYIRMAKKDLDNAIKEIQGIKSKEGEKKVSLRSIKCPNCGATNPGTRDYCQECDQLISRDKALIREAKQEEVKEEVKTELLMDMFEEFDIDKDKGRDKIESLIESRLKEKGYD